MKNLIMTVSLLMACGCIHTQTWDGGGGDTDWNNAANWNPDIVPSASALVDFPISTTVTATGAVAPPARVRVTGTNTVLTLDFDLTAGDGLTNVNAVQLTTGNSLVVATTRTLVLNPPMTANAIQVGSGAPNASITVENDAAINVILAKRGINLRSNGTTFTNNGTITIGGCDGDAINIVSGVTFTNTGTMTAGFVTNGDGIDNSGNVENTGAITIISSDFKGIRNNPTGVFTNNGLIDISDLLLTTDDGIFTRGIFNNGTVGTIMVAEMIDDAVEVTDGTFTNSGIMNLTSKNTAIASNLGLAVGTGSATGAFVNAGILEIDAGSGTNARAITVFQVSSMSLSSLSNSGLITVSGGNPTQLFFNRGLTTNQPTGTINTNLGRVNANLGTFTNNGLLEGNYSGAPSVFTGPGGTSVNDGFYRHNAANFSNGSGSITNNGVNMNDATQTTFDLMGGCTVTVAGTGATQVWLNSLGDTIDLSGPEITFFDALPDVMSSVISASAIDVDLTVTNVCAQGILPIELTSFTATPRTKSILLKWTTAGELDNDYMAVERSRDGRHFSEIGRRAGAGTTTLAQTYELEDLQPTRGFNYYRLRQVDTDGTFSYSEIVVVDFRGTTDAATLVITPNPVPRGGTIQLNLTDQPATIGRYSIVNVQGQHLVTHELVGGVIQEIPLDGLPGGIYVLSRTDSEEIRGSRFIVLE